MDITRHRGTLSHTFAALQRGALTIGFIGGSITDMRANWNWPEPVAAWFLQTFPGLRLTIENAAIGATGSDLAVFRAQRDLIERGCHLVFIEFAVNDNGSPPLQRMRSREGLVRKLLRTGQCDVLFAYTYSQPMYAEMLAGKMPASIAEFEQLGEHYGIGSIWMGLAAFQEVLKGRMRWEEWLPDGLHPQYRGSACYSQAVTDYLAQELLPAGKPPQPPSTATLPAPVQEGHWENAFCLPFDQVTLKGPWVVQRWNKLSWIDQALRTSAPGARLSFDFSGTGILFGFDFGKSSAEFRYRIDGGDWQTSWRDRPDWAGQEGWYRATLLAETLPTGSHHFELEVTHGNPNDDPARAGQVTGTNFNLGLIGILVD